MFKRKLHLTITAVLILFFVLAACSPQETIKLGPINPRDVESINRAGGLPLSRWKVLFAEKDYSTIEKITALVNSTKKADFNAKNYGGSNEIGYPIGIEIRLKNNVMWQMAPLFNVFYETLKDGGIESTAIPYKDRVRLDVKNGRKSSSYTLLSKQLADYVLKGANQDMPYVKAFSITPDTIKPGQIVTISGDGSTEKFIKIYITDGNSASDEN